MIKRFLHTFTLTLLLGAFVSFAGCSAEMSDGSHAPEQDAFVGDDAAADETANSPGCAEGETRVAADGCNVCTCVNAGWLCTEEACSCPLPRTTAPDGEGCGSAVVYARDSETGTCCMYDNSCEAPEGWPTHFSANECQNSCVPGETRPDDDGCNTCECTDSGEWACTEAACMGIQGCAADEDCVISGCSGEICAQESISTTCEFREEYACYDETITSCGCVSGQCAWRDTPELTSCLQGTTRCEPGDVKMDTDGCNTCFCTDTGDWACTDRACDQTCPAAQQPEPNEDCNDAIVFARDPATGLCCEYSDSCGPPDGWETFGDAASCTALAGCSPGSQRLAGDGCNTCTCGADGTWSCTEQPCARLCDTSADCLITGCSGQICAAEHVFTTCEDRPEYACFAPDITTCGCNQGICEWEQTDALIGCLADPMPVP